MSQIFVPNEDQLAGIRFGMEKSYGAFFWDPGTRKTSTFLFIYKLLREAGLVNRMLVLSTVNIINDTWPDEMEKWSDLDVTYSMMGGGSAAKRAKGFELDADVYLMNNDNVEWFYEEYVHGKKNFPFDMLVVDESTKFRNRGTDRFRALRKMIPKFKRRYIGTGTPTPKGYINLWSQMYIVDQGESLGVTLGAYRNKYFQPGGFKGKHWELREGSEPEIQRAIAHRVSRVEKHLDVAISFVDREVRLPPKAMDAYKELEEEFITNWRGKTLMASNAAVATQKLRQAANGAVYLERLDKRDPRKWVQIHTEKIEELKRIIKELRGKPLLLAYEFQHDYEMMMKHGLKFPSYSVAKPGRERTELKDRWNRGELTVLGGQLSSMSHGLNVQFGGHYLGYYGLTYNLEDFEQFYQRLWRDGQEHDVTAFRIGAVGTVDQTMMDVLHVRDHDQKMLLRALLRRFDL